MNYPKISLVTISLNSSAFIEDSICSVLDQQYPNLEYIIIDGGSTDGTLDIIKKYQDKISYFVSEKDTGPFDALSKGFEKSTGEIMCWLNSDDSMHSKSLFAVAGIFNSFENVEWIMGYPSWLNNRGICMNEIFYIQDKFFYSPKFINDNLYIKFACWSKWRFAMDDFSAIQQESVFWRRSLWEKAGGHVKKGIVAYDLELWIRFFAHARLYTTNILFASFRVHGNQISETSRLGYKNEAQQHINSFKVQLLAGSVKNRLRIFIGKAMKVFYYYNIPVLKLVYPCLLDLPPFIYYDLQLRQFRLSNGQ